MPFDSEIFPESSFLLETHRFYASLIGFASSTSDSDNEPSLGGKLLYGGALDVQGRALAVAGNIAGAATLTATVETSAQKQAIRDGVVDFLVTSLDEALRILKNEIRKRETVAVCVSAAPANLERQMTERGVLPDLIFGGLPGAARNSTGFGASATRFHLNDADESETYLTWKIEEAPAKWMPKLDALAIDCLGATPWEARWLRLAPRYCGRPAQGVRVLHCDAQVAKQIMKSIANAVEQREVGVQVRISAIVDGQSFTALHSPPIERKSAR